MSDLRGVDGSAIALGNMRHQATRDFNARVKEHNDQVATTISSLKDQVQTNANIKEAQDVAQNLWTGHGMPDKIKAYQEWRAGKAGGDADADAPTSGTTPEGTQATAQSDSATTISDDAETPDAATTDAAPDEPVDEGSPTGVGPEEEAESLTGKLKSGIVRSTGISKEGLEEGLEMAGKGATIAGAIGIGGMDAYNEYKSLAAGKGLSGDNWEEKTGNLLQLGGSVSDIVGTFFPPAKLLGGILDLSAGALDVVGEKVAEGSKEGQLDTTESQDDEQGQALSAAPTQVTGSVQ